MIQRTIFVTKILCIADVKSLSRPECFLIYLHISLLLPLLPRRTGLCLWATYLMYSQYNRKYSDEIRSCIEKTLLEKINTIRVQKSVYEYREFWWILIFN